MPAQPAKAGRMAEDRGVDGGENPQVEEHPPASPSTELSSFGKSSRFSMCRSGYNSSAPSIQTARFSTIITATPSRRS